MLITGGSALLLALFFLSFFQITLVLEEMSGFVFNVAVAQRYCAYNPWCPGRCIAFVGHVKMLVEDLFLIINP